MMNKECNKLFDELCDYSDDPCIMHEFIECLKYWVINWNKGNIKVCLIDLNEIDNNFKQSLYIAYNSCDGCSGESIWNPFDFIKYIQETYNDYSDDLNPEEFWTKVLQSLLYD